MSPKPKPLPSLGIKPLCVITVSLPLLAFAFCLLYSWSHHFILTTRTHCRVYNFAPSVSATLNVPRPQAAVWRLAVALHAPARMALALLHWRRLRNALPSSRAKVDVALILFVVELCSLLGLSFVASKESYSVHRFAFSSFVVFHLAHAALLVRLCAEAASAAPEDQKALRWRKRSLALFVSGLASAAYFFYRHNRYCEPGVYSLFSMSEYVVVLSNMGCRCAAYFDMADVSLGFFETKKSQ